LFSGQIENVQIPSILAAAGAGLEVDVQNLADTTVAAGANLFAGDSLDVTALAKTIVVAQTTMTTEGALLSSATSGADVFVDSDAVVHLEDGAVIEGSVVAIRAENQIDARALAGIGADGGVSMGMLPPASRR
jgi:hypothetical protein